MKSSLSHVTFNLNTALIGHDQALPESQLSAVESKVLLNSHVSSKSGLRPITVANEQHQMPEVHRQACFYPQ